jgi:hypothetical protein
MKPVHIMPLLLLILALLPGCAGVSATVEPAALAPTSEVTAVVPAEVRATPTDAVIVDEATAEATPEPVPAEPEETAEPEAPEAPGNGGASLPPGALSYALGTIYDEARGWVLRGVVPDGDGWTDAELPLPEGVQATNADYDPRTHQALAWDYTPGVGAGPGNLASGPLVLIDFNTDTAATLIPERVVSARWASDGQGFAFLLATDETYELTWRDAAGTDHVLATDVPREFTFAPDGSAIAFTRESGYSLATAPGLYVVDIATGEERMLSDVDRAGTGGSGPGWAPIWSPGSESVLLRAYADASERIIWADAGGAWTQTITLSDLNAAAGAELGIEDTCTNEEFFLTGPTTVVFGAGECPEHPLMGAFPEASHVVAVELDPASGALTPAGSVPSPIGLVTFLDWDAGSRTLGISGYNDPAGNEIHNIQLP